MRHRIGTITLQRTTTFKTMEQTACNYRLVEVPRGTTAVLYHDTEHGREDIAWTWEGTCTESYFVNRLGASSARAADTESGKPMGFYERRYAYDLIRTVYNTLYKIILDEGVTVTAEVKTHSEGSEWAHTSVLARIQTVAAKRIADGRDPLTGALLPGTYCHGAPTCMVEDCEHCTVA